MILDKENLFSDAQAITASAASTNVLKLPKGLAKGEPVRLLCQVVETFATLTSLKVAVRSDGALSGSDLLSANTHVETAAIPVASLVAGYQFTVEYMPSGTEEYVDLYYTVAGSNATAGKITAGVVFDRQTAR